jgi:thiosulfate reductase cytochrome b subunit
MTAELVGLETMQEWHDVCYWLLVAGLDLGIVERFQES